MSHHFQSPQVIENVSKEEIAFSLYDEKNFMEGIFRDSLKNAWFSRPAKVSVTALTKAFRASAQA
ncbi:hypothetical protein [Thiolapillus sp.]